jgi:hypothetical protein
VKKIHRLMLASSRRAIIAKFRNWAMKKARENEEARERFAAHQPKKSVLSPGGMFPVSVDTLTGTAG